MSRVRDQILDEVIRKERHEALCSGPKMRTPPPGGMGLDKRVACVVCGRRVKLTARGLYARHNRKPPDGKERG